MTFVHIIEFYYVARFLAGISVSGIQNVFNLYLSEVAGKSKRGSIVSLVASVSVLGFLYSYAVGPFVSIQIFNSTLIVFPTLFLITFSLIGVETPHYFMMKGNKDIARKVLLRLRGNERDIEEEMTQIQEQIDETSQKRLIELLKLRQAAIGFVNGVGLFIFQLLAGIYCVQFYNQQIFEMTGSNIKPELCSIIIATLQFIGSLVASLLMELFPRKSMLYFSAIGMALSQIPLGIYCCLQSNGTNMSSINFLPILFMSTFILSYSSAFGALPFTIPSELFPPACKGFALSLVGFVNAVGNFILTKYFQTFVDGIGIGGVFIVFATCCLTSVFFVKFFVVETRGKSLEMIQEELKERKIFNWKS